MPKGWWVDTANRNLLVDEDTLQVTDSAVFGGGDDLYEILVQSPDARADARRTLYGLPPERRAVVADLITRAEAEARSFFVPPPEHMEQIPIAALRPYPFEGTAPRGLP